MRYVQQNKYVMSCGVETDFSVLIQRFVATQSVRYEHFAEIWREMNFSLIFAGRVRDQEVRQVGTGKICSLSLSLSCSYLIIGGEHKIIPISLCEYNFKADVAKFVLRCYIFVNKKLM